MSLREAQRDVTLWRAAVRDWAGPPERTNQQVLMTAPDGAGGTGNATLNATHLFILDLSELDGTDVML